MKVSRGQAKIGLAAVGEGGQAQKGKSGSPPLVCRGQGVRQGLPVAGADTSKVVSRLGQGELAIRASPHLVCSIIVLTIVLPPTNLANVVPDTFYRVVVTAWAPL
jgi:hypothetical protein